MTKVLFAAVLAAGPIAAPLPKLTQTAAVQTQTDKKKTKKETKAKKQPSAGMKCGAEWKEAKTASKIEKGQKWPQIWSACNKRLKAAS